MSTMASGPITIEDTGGLGPITVAAPPGRQTVTPASLMAVASIGTNADLLRGCGIDWGAGTGLLTIGAALVHDVDLVLGLELGAIDIPVARANAVRNGVGDTTRFVNADSFRAVDPSEQATIDALRGRADFLVANPPASLTGDGLDWRREALRGALDFLVPGAPVLLQISYQYSMARITGLVDDAPGYVYEGLAGTTGWMPFDQSRDDLAVQLAAYARVEQAGGIPYTFSDGAGGHQTATEALEQYRATGENPQSKWQMHLFLRTA